MPGHIWESRRARRGIQILILMLSGAFAGCGRSVTTSSLREEIDAINAVDRLGVPIQFSFDPDDLPPAGRANRSVWSGNWWPLSKGGTIAAMAKLDAVQGSRGRAQAWEQSTVDRSGHVPWAGHCNGLAAAGINEAEPKRGASYAGQTFSPSEVQALLVEKWQGVKRVTLVGQRCGGDVSQDADGRLKDPGCRDINPASFHVVLGNLLGLKGEPFIVDISVGEEVWNYPVTGYSSSIAGLTREAATRLVEGRDDGSYHWNPRADLFMKVQTTIRLANGGSMTLDYVLEGHDFEIIGGEWIGASKKEHPDFAWTTTVPEPANPFVDVSVIDAIAAKSR